MGWRGRMRDEVELTDVSVLICTRDRATKLAACLQAIAVSVRAAAEAGVMADVVLVNNGSTDDTARVLAAWADAQPFAVRLVSEPRVGLARARNPGLKHANGSVIAMTDEVCVAAQDFVLTVARAFGEDSVPTIRGGRVELGDTADLPISIKVETEPWTLERWMTPGGFIIGANFSFEARRPSRPWASSTKPGFGRGALQGRGGHRLPDPCPCARDPGDLRPKDRR